MTANAEAYQLNEAEISSEIRGMNINTLADMIIALDNHKAIRLMTVEAGEQWVALVELAKGVRQ